MSNARDESLQETGKCALGALREMVAALECDYDRLEELRDERADLVSEAEDDTNVEHRAAKRALKEWDEENGDELKDLVDSAGDCKDRDDAEQRIHEDPLSLEFRSGWVTDKSDLSTPEEARILLTTGGPAVQIIVELDNGEPHRAYLQVQDWGTPWTDYYEDGIGDVLMSYARCFCFE